eukprot:Phypoly_transcript_09428.p1 GENE.Phypoly_transcript_09428~~Phypoly_transcript_09428.p1  ORF type:complete len:429 (+),score=62.47 Phypoly_transcript_09428:44-1330(+)
METIKKLFMRKQSQPPPKQPTAIAGPFIDDFKVPSYAHIEKKIGIAAIGVGARLSSLLVDLMYTHIGLVELRGIADEAEPALNKTKEMLREFKFEVFTDYKELLKVPDIDWVLIGSKNSQHREHCIASFQAGKHVFCEKPLAITLDECEEIHKEYLKSGKLFATGFVLRHAPLYMRIRDIAQNKETFGKMISIEACENIPPEHGGYIMRNWRRHRAEAGPHILEKCCHDIDILLWVVGCLPARVAAFGGTNIFVPENAPPPGEVQERYKWWNFAWEDVDPFTVEKDIEDNIVVIIEFRNNVRVTFHANSNCANPQRRISICGTKGAVEGDLYKSKYTSKSVDPTVADKTEEIRGIGIHGGGDKNIVDDLAKCIEKNTPPKAKGEDALVSTIVCLAIDEARREQRIVALDPIWQRFGFRDESFQNWQAE